MVKVDGQVVDSTSYDHGGIRRLRKDGAGKTKSYSSGSLSLCDTRPTGPIAFIQGHQLLGLEESGNCYYFITDGLSSVRVVVDASCNAQGEFRYDEFGQLESSSQPAAALASHAYVGGLGQRNEMGGLGLYYARQRWYDASLGRWISQDPIGFEGGLNVFGYSNNNPINFVDPDGLKPPPQWVETWLDLVDATLTVYGGTIGGKAGGAAGFSCGAASGLSTGPGALAASPAMGVVGGALGAATGTAAGAGLGHLTGLGLKALVRGGYGMMSEASPPAGTSGGNPFLPNDPYSPESVALRIKPPYRANPKHNARAPHNRAAIEPCDSVEVYKKAKRHNNMYTFWEKGKEGFYRFFDDNAGAAHFSGVFDSKSPLVPNFLKRR